MTEKCVVCGLRWHICRDKKIPPGGYVCPRCDGRRREPPEGKCSKTTREGEKKGWKA